MTKLIISRDGEATRTVVLAKERTSLGRHRSNDIVLEHPTVSGQHALIVTILDEAHLEDLNSTNGTFVNGHRIGKHFLQPNDRIMLAKYQLQFVADGIRPSGTGTPVLAQIEVLNGANAGKQLALTKPQTTLGRAGVQVVVVTRGLDAYAITHVEGEQAPLVNGAALGKRQQTLHHGDVIELTGTRMVFRLV